MSNAQSSNPAQGYDTKDLLIGIVKTKTTDLIKREAVKFASNKGVSAINDQLGQVGLASGIKSSAVNAALQGARSASEKLNGALGGKLSSVLGSGSSAQTAAQATKQITNLATGSVSKISSMVQNKLGSALSGVLGASVGGMLGSTLSKLTDTASKNLAGANLVAGFLETGPEDKSLVVDPYGVSDNKILNALSDQISGIAKDAFNNIRQSPNLVSDLVTMVASGKTNWAITKEGLANRVVSALGGRTGILNNLSSGLKDSITNATGLPEGIYDTAVALLGGQRVNFNAGQMDSAKEVFSLINQITASNEMKGFFDIGSESSLMASVMREAIALGVPDAIDVLVDNAKDDQIAYNALYANVQVAFESSDLDTINLMIEKIGVNGILAQVPNAVPLLLSYYELPGGTTSENYDNELDALKAVLTTLRPNWGLVMRDGEWISDLTAFAEISDDARKLMMRDSDLLIPVLIGSTYAQRNNLMADLKKQYPLLPILTA
jgi:hypothetical protein